MGEYAGQRDDSHSGWDGMGKREISSSYSELYAMNCLFLEFSMEYFWTSVDRG